MTQDVTVCPRHLFYVFMYQGLFRLLNNHICLQLVEKKNFILLTPVITFRSLESRKEREQVPHPRV